MKPQSVREFLNKPFITSVQASADAVSLKWSESFGAKKYVIKISREPDAGYEKAAAVLGPETSCLCPLPEEDGVYWYKVAAIGKRDGERVVKRSRPKSIDIKRLSAVEGLCAFPTKDGKVALRWNAVKNAGGYIIKKRYGFMPSAIQIGKTASEEDEDGEPIDLTEITSFEDLNAVSGQLYYYTVTPFEGGEDSMNIGGECGELAFVHIDAPTVLKIKKQFGKKLGFSFRLTAGADKYLVLKSSAEDGEYVRCAETTLADDLVCTETGNSGEKGAFYKFVCAKYDGEREFLGDETEPIYIKYKL